MSLKARLVVTVLILLLLSGSAVTTALWWISTQAMDTISRDAVLALEERAAEHMTSLRQAKAAHLENMFRYLRNNILLLSKDPSVIDATRNLNRTFTSIYFDAPEWLEQDMARAAMLADYQGPDHLANPLFDRYADLPGANMPEDAETLLPTTDNGLFLQYMYVSGKENAHPVGQKALLDYNPIETAYNSYHSKYHSLFRDVVRVNGYHDVAIIAPETGMVSYTVVKELQTGTSLLEGPYRDSNMADCYRQANAVGLRGEHDLIVVVDFAPFQPSYNAPAMFVATPVYDEVDQYIGVLMAQISVDVINNAILGGATWEDAGLGETGQAFLVGEDLRLRSDLRFSNRNSDSLATAMDTPVVRQALQGDSGSGEMSGPDDIPLLASWQPLNLGGLELALVVEINRDEAMQAARGISLLTENTRENMLYGAGSVLAVALALSALAGILTILALFRPISRIKQYAEVVSRGDLDATIDGSFGPELNSLRDSIRNMVGELKELIATTEAKTREAVTEAQKAIQANIQTEKARDIAQRAENYQKDEIEKLNNVFFEMANGNLAVRYRTGEADADLKDVRKGFQDLEKSLSITNGNLGTLINQIMSASTILIKSSEHFLTLSREMLEGSEEMSAQSGNVAGATEQMSMNINTMASSAEEMSMNVSTISSTAEEMSQTMNNVTQGVEHVTLAINDIAGNAQAGTQISAQAKSMANQATDTMKVLGHAAQEIGQVTNVIKRIAEQTNLLALNATIEAASAGEAGRGFAVVANEIKELANQSAKAAEDIANKIRGVQVNTDDAVDVIAQVTNIISRITESVSIISTAVDTQTESVEQVLMNVGETNKGAAAMAQSIAELSNGANDMSLNAGEIAKGVNEVAANIVNVSKLARLGNHGSRRVAQVATELSNVAGELRSTISKFTI